ncbi:MAG: DUF6145 family protein [Lachnospiraceae bacterium]
MYQDKIVLCGSNAYEKKYYLNDDFANLPQQVKDELQIMCVLYTEEIGGILTLVYDQTGNLEFEVTYDEGDLLFDEIGSVLKIKQLREEKKDLLEALEMYFKVFFLGEDIEE